VKLELHGTEIEFHIDTGMEITVISDAVHKKLGNLILTQTPSSANSGQVFD